MSEDQKTFGDYLNVHSVSRRSFLKFCGAMAAALALPSVYAGKIATALAAATRLPVIWLEFQDCTGDTESFIRAGSYADPLTAGTTDPSVLNLLLDYISLDYHETLMAPAGTASEKSLNDSIAAHAGNYVVVVEGSIPTAQNGIFCTIRGKTALSIAQQVIKGAKANIAAGSCAYDGGLAAAAPNPTGAVGVLQAVPNAPNLINLPGCPTNVVNVMACLVNYLALGDWPALDSATRRPLFAYGNAIHATCERRTYFEQGKFVHAWGDADHRAGHCLFQMGCRGPRATSNCNKVYWNNYANWPVAAGHGCLACTTPHFWDNQKNFYVALPDD
jgi:hydrogenase small subunit